MKSETLFGILIGFLAFAIVVALYSALAGQTTVEQTLAGQ
jgi:hypothetical protein